MLLNLTCPSCGRVEEVSERVLGKEVRCPCGTQFRVLQPKRPLGDPGAAEPPRSQTPEKPKPARRPPEPQSRPPETRPKPPASVPRERPVPAPRERRLGLLTTIFARRRRPASSRSRRKARARRRGLMRPSEPAE